MTLEQCFHLPHITAFNGPHCIFELRTNYNSYLPATRIMSHQRWSDIIFDTHGSMHRRLLSRNTNKMQLCNRIYYSKVFLKAQHVSSGTPLIIRSSKLYLKPLVYMPIWWPAIAKAEWDFLLSLGNGRSPYGHINQRCVARNMLSLQKNFGIINFITKLHLVGISTECFI